MLDSVGQTQECSKDFAPPIVGLADDGDLGDRRVLHQDLLDLGREQVLAATDHHVLESADDAAVVAVAHGGEIARR